MQKMRRCGHSVSLALHGRHELCPVGVMTAKVPVICSYMIYNNCSIVPCIELMAKGNCDLSHDNSKEDTNGLLQYEYVW